MQRYGSASSFMYSLVQQTYVKGMEYFSILH